MQFKIINAQDLDKQQRYQISELCFAAFDEDPWSQYAFMQNAVHIIGLIDDAIVSHALWTDRIFTLNENVILKTAYVEYVTTDFTMRGQGLASQLLMSLVNILTANKYELAALQPEVAAFYRKLGWISWKGNLFIRHDDCIYETDETEIMLYPLNSELKDQIEHSSQKDKICTDWREGELW